MPLSRPLGRDDPSVVSHRQSALIPSKGIVTGFCHRLRQDGWLARAWPAYDPAPGGGPGKCDASRDAAVVSERPERTARGVDAGQNPSFFADVSSGGRPGLRRSGLSR